ncbi:hypothetical protein MMPV_007676 [Pyropia vietnamensis]
MSAPSHSFSLPPPPPDDERQRHMAVAVAIPWAAVDMALGDAAIAGGMAGGVGDGRSDTVGTSRLVAFATELPPSLEGPDCGGNSRGRNGDADEERARRLAVSARRRAAASAPPVLGGRAVGLLDGASRGRLLAGLAVGPAAAAPAAVAPRAWLALDRLRLSTEVADTSATGGQGGGDGGSGATTTPAVPPPHAPAGGPTHPVETLTAVFVAAARDEALDSERGARPPVPRDGVATSWPPWPAGGATAGMGMAAEGVPAHPDFVDTGPLPDYLDDPFSGSDAPPPLPVSVPAAAVTSPLPGSPAPLRAVTGGGGGEMASSAVMSPVAAPVDNRRVSVRRPPLDGRVGGRGVTAGTTSPAGAGTAEAEVAALSPPTLKRRRIGSSGGDTDTAGGGAPLSRSVSPPFHPSLMGLMGSPGSMPSPPLPSTGVRSGRRPPPLPSTAALPPSTPSPLPPVPRLRPVDGADVKTAAPAPRSTRSCEPSVQRQPAAATTARSAGSLACASRVGRKSSPTVQRSPASTSPPPTCPASPPRTSMRLRRERRHAAVPADHVHVDEACDGMTDNSDYLVSVSDKGEDGPLEGEEGASSALPPPPGAPPSIATAVASAASPATKATAAAAAAAVGSTARAPRPRARAPAAGAIAAKRQKKGEEEDDDDTEREPEEYEEDDSDYEADTDADMADEADESDVGELDPSAGLVVQPSAWPPPPKRAMLHVTGDTSPLTAPAGGVTAASPRSASLRRRRPSHRVVHSVSRRPSPPSVPQPRQLATGPRPAAAAGPPLQGRSSPSLAGLARAAAAAQSLSQSLPVVENAGTGGASTVDGGRAVTGAGVGGSPAYNSASDSFSDSEVLASGAVGESRVAETAGGVDDSWSGGVRGGVGVVAAPALPSLPNRRRRHRPSPSTTSTTHPAAAAAAAVEAGTPAAANAAGGSARLMRSRAHAPPRQALRGDRLRSSSSSPLPPPPTPPPQVRLVDGTRASARGGRVVLATDTWLAAAAKTAKESGAKATADAAARQAARAAKKADAKAAADATAEAVAEAAAEAAARATDRATAKAAAKAAARKAIRVSAAAAAAASTAGQRAARRPLAATTLPPPTDGTCTSAAVTPAMALASTTSAPRQAKAQPTPWQRRPPALPGGAPPSDRSVPIVADAAAATAAAALTAAANPVRARSRVAASPASVSAAARPPSSLSKPPSEWGVPYTREWWRAIAAAAAAAAGDAPQATAAAAPEAAVGAATTAAHTAVALPRRTAPAVAAVAVPDLASTTGPVAVGAGGGLMQVPAPAAAVPRRRRPRAADTVKVGGGGGGRTVPAGPVKVSADGRWTNLPPPTAAPATAQAVPPSAVQPRVPLQVPAAAAAPSRPLAVAAAGKSSPVLEVVARESIPSSFVAAGGTAGASLASDAPAAASAAATAAALAASRAASRAALDAIIERSPGAGLSPAERTIVDRFAAGDSSLFDTAAGVTTIDMTLNRFVVGGRTGRCVLRLSADMTWTTIRKFQRQKGGPPEAVTEVVAANAAAARRPQMEPS